MSILIRAAIDQDTVPLAAISRATFYDSFSAENTEADMQKHLQDYYADEKIRAEIADADNLFLLAIENDSLIGYCKLSTKKKSEAAALATPIEIERIYAIQSAIGKGVGKSLMEASIQYAIGHHYATIWLGVWEHNPRAIGFYSKWGFEKFGEHLFVVGNDPQTDWLMKKTLS